MRYRTHWQHSAIAATHNKHFRILILTSMRWLDTGTCKRNCKKTINRKLTQEKMQDNYCESPAYTAYDSIVFRCHRRLRLRCQIDFTWNAISDMFGRNRCSYVENLFRCYTQTHIHIRGESVFYHSNDRHHFVVLLSSERSIQNRTERVAVNACGLNGFASILCVSSSSHFLYSFPLISNAMYFDCSPTFGGSDLKPKADKRFTQHDHESKLIEKKMKTKMHSFLSIIIIIIYNSILFVFFIVILLNACQLHHHLRP